MSAGYCYMCDAPTEADPCPTCGRALAPPEAARQSQGSTWRDQLVTPEAPPPPLHRRLPLRTVVLGGAIVVLVILLILRWEIGL